MCVCVLWLMADGNSALHYCHDSLERGDKETLVELKTDFNNSKGHTSTGWNTTWRLEDI